MIPLAQYHGQSVGVMGLGKAGLATVKALLAGGARVWMWDDGEAGRSGAAAGVDASLAPFADWPWSDLKAMVLSPGIPLTHPAPHPSVVAARRHRCPVVGDIELLLRACDRARTIGITGTNGKSTTTSLIAHILKQAGERVEVGGNLGMAALSLAPLDERGVYVLETSSYQLDLLDAARFDIAVWLNLTPDHLDRHGDMDGYMRAKQRIFKHQRPQDTAIIGVDDAYCESVARLLLAENKQRVIPISVTQTVGNGIYVKDGILHNKLADGPADLDLRGIERLPGAHNWQNAAAAYAACYSYGLGHEAIEAGIKTFPGLAHRMQWVAEMNGVRFINDSKATNADAAEKALKAYDTVYWIAGGKPKEGGIETLAPLFPRMVRAYLIGEAAKAFEATLKGHVDTVLCGDLRTATERAANDAWQEKRPGAVVLLSPACASFDQFKNFEQRGDAFIETVRGLHAV